MYTERPTIKGHYTKEDLEEYALYRKAGAIGTIQAILADANVISGDLSPEEHEEYCKPLAISREMIVDIQLSTGGDADGFNLTFDEQYELVSGVYYWADWGVYEEVSLSHEEIELVDSLYAVRDWIESQ